MYIEGKFNDYQDSGVYWIGDELTIDEVTYFSTSQKFLFFHVNGKNISTKRDLIENISALMSFPDYVQLNWDSFEECFTDLEWKPSKGYVLLYENYKSFMENDPSQWKIFLAILGSAASFWKKKNVHFYVFLRTGKSS
jgi:hypothetical protein